MQCPPRQRLRSSRFYVHLNCMGKETAIYQYNRIAISSPIGRT
jgi:hypothetical protein